jgi:hypothetical protein
MYYAKVKNRKNAEPWYDGDVLLKKTFDDVIAMHVKLYR